MNATGQGNNLSSGASSPMVNKSSYSMSTTATPNTGKTNNVVSFSRLSLATDVGVSTPTSTSPDDESMNSSDLSGIGKGGMGKVNGFVLGGGLPAYASQLERKNDKALRLANDRPCSKDELHSQLRAIDEQYRCDLADLQAVFKAERRRIMGDLRLVQEGRMNTPST